MEQITLKHKVGDTITAMFYGECPEGEEITGVIEFIESYLSEGEDCKKKVSTEYYIKVDGVRGEYNVYEEDIITEPTACENYITDMLGAKVYAVEKELGYVAEGTVKQVLLMVEKSGVDWRYDVGKHYKSYYNGDLTTDKMEACKKMIYNIDE